MPAEAVSAVSSRMRALISLAVADAVGSPLEIVGHIEVGLVERKRLDQRGVFPEDRMDLPRHCAIDVEPRRDEDELEAVSLRGR